MVDPDFRLTGELVLSVTRKYRRTGWGPWPDFLSLDNLCSIKKLDKPV